MHILNILIGISMLLLGRRLYWLFVGAAGFILGVHASSFLLHGRPQWVMLAIALAIGLLGALFALLLQRLAIGIAGFFLGGYVLKVIMLELGWGTAQYGWPVFLIGGIIGLLLISSLFDWALIILSSITGAILVLQPFHSANIINRVLLLLLIVFGISVQAGLMRKTPGGRVKR